MKAVNFMPKKGALSKTLWLKRTSMNIPNKTQDRKGYTEHQQLPLLSLCSQPISDRIRKAEPPYRVNSAHWIWRSVGSVSIPKSLIFHLKTT